MRKAAHPDRSTGFTTDQREVYPDRTDGDVWIAFTDRLNKTRDIETLGRETLLAGCSPTVLKAQEEPQEPPHLHGWPLLYGLPWKSSPQQKSGKYERQPVGQKHGWHGGSESERSQEGHGRAESRTRPSGPGVPTRN